MCELALLDCQYFDTIPFKRIFESLDFRLGIVPPALNRKSISRLLTAAGREKLLISAADLCKCPDCLRSTCLFDLNRHCSTAAVC
jgi:hypothetical protein